MTEKKKLGRKPKEEGDKVKTKHVYLSDKQESEILKNAKAEDLTEVLKQHIKPNRKTR